MKQLIAASTVLAFISLCCEKPESMSSDEPTSPVFISGTMNTVYCYMETQNPITDTANNGIKEIWFYGMPGEETNPGSPRTFYTTDTGLYRPKYTITYNGPVIEKKHVVGNKKGSLQLEIDYRDYFLSAKSSYSNFYYNTKNSAAFYLDFQYGKETDSVSTELVLTQLNKLLKQMQNINYY